MRYVFTGLLIVSGLIVGSLLGVLFYILLQGVFWLFIFGDLQPSWTNSQVLFLIVVLTPGFIGSYIGYLVSKYLRRRS
jgi:hypothetical protein